MIKTAKLNATQYMRQATGPPSPRKQPAKAMRTLRAVPTDMMVEGNSITPRGYLSPHRFTDLASQTISEHALNLTAAGTGAGAYASPGHETTRIEDQEEFAGGGVYSELQTNPIRSPRGDGADEIC